jgi:hypothetical protein
VGPLVELSSDLDSFNIDEPEAISGGRVSVIPPFYLKTEEEPASET